jgi:hypothetical protein
MTAGNWFYLTGHTEYRCDITAETVANPEGIILDPWALRLWPSLLDHLLGRVGDQSALTQTVHRDWSPWLLSEEFRELIENATEDGRLFPTVDGRVR